jgi:hypothetical protein
MSHRRVQRSRRPGARLPAGAVYVGKPTRWANRHDWRILGRAEAVRRYAADLAEMPAADRRALLAPLEGASALACWCPPGEPCHADVLLAARLHHDCREASTTPPAVPAETNGG